MLQHPVDMPLEVREFASRHHYAVPKTAKCETFFAPLNAGPAGDQPPPADHLRVLVATQALAREGERYWSAVIWAGNAAQRESLKQHFLQLLRISNLTMPDSRSTCEEEFIFLQAPWVFRGELRTLVSRAALTWAPPRPAQQVQAEIAQQDTPEKVGDIPSVFISLPGGGASEVDVKLFRDQLMKFGMAFDGTLQLVLRKALSREDTRAWKFPLGCTVVETRSSGNVSWTIEFEDLEMTERAHLLLTPVLLEMRRLGSRLRPEHASVADLDDDVITQIPALCIATDGNTQAARVEMMRLLRNLILSLDRMRVSEEFEQVGAA